jgi:lipopolysaccharide export system protein LptA
MVNMEESLSWKSIFWGVFFSLFVLGLTYWLISPRDNTFFTQDKSDQLAQFGPLRVVGRQDGKTVWELRAGGGWSDKAQEITYLKEIKQGKIFNKKNQLILRDLSAPDARAWRHSEIVDASGGVRAYLDLGKFTTAPKKQSAWTKLTAMEIKYTPAMKKSELAGLVKLVKRDSVISAERMTIDHERRVALLAGAINLTRRDSVIKADSLEYHGETEELKAAGNIKLKLRESRTSTVIKCAQADLFVDLNKDIDLQGSLEVTQGKKLSRADSGTYSRSQQKLFLRGRTKTVLAKVAAEIRPETVRKLDAPEQKQLLRQKTVILAKEIVFSLKTGDARATGSVAVTQKGREARSDNALYDDKKELLTLSGNVHLKRGDEWIACRSVIVSVGKESFEALGVTEAKFKL